MEQILPFLKILINKSNNYQLIWTYILGKINVIGSTEISIHEIQVKYKIPKSSIYNILNFGFDYFKEKKTDKIFYLKNNIIFIVNHETIPDKTKKSRTIIISSNNSSNTIKGKQKTIIQSTEYDEIILGIISFLNTTSNKNFSIINSETKQIIIDRLLDGFIQEDFLKVIRLKCKQWKNTFNDKYLRPITLFGDKMEYYVNETEIAPETQKKSQTQLTYETTNEAKQLLATRYNQKPIS